MGFPKPSITADKQFIMHDPSYQARNLLAENSIWSMSRLMSFAMVKSRHLGSCDTLCSNSAFGSDQS